MVVTAKGNSGACVDYIRRTFEGLSSIGFDDPEVTGLWEAVRNHPTAASSWRLASCSLQARVPVALS
jgi:hypothetical protein